MKTALYAEGSNSGKLGTGDIFDKNNGPVKIMDNITDVSSGANETVALDSGGNIWYWGADCLSPKQVGSQAKAIAINRIDEDYKNEPLYNRHKKARYAWLTNEDVIESEGDLPYRGIQINGAKKVRFSADAFFVLCEDGTLYADIKPLLYDVNCVMGRYINNIFSSGKKTEYEKQYCDNLEVFAADVADISVFSANVALLHKDGTVWAWNSFSPNQLTYVCDNATDVKINFKGFLCVKNSKNQLVDYFYDVHEKADDSPLFDSKIRAGNVEGIAMTSGYSWWFVKDEQINVGRNANGFTVPDGSRKITKIVSGIASKFYIVEER